MKTLSAPVCDPDRVDALLSSRGHAALDRAGLERLLGGALPLERWAPAWDALPADGYLRDGGRYRRRRHGCYIVRSGSARAQPRRAHWQPVEYNALHGGIERWFEAVPLEIEGDAAWLALLVALSDRAGALRGSPEGPWFVEAHMFRIDTTDGIGRPTPEGAHRDGVDLVAVMLVAREGVRGGETRVFDADGPDGTRFTMVTPGTILLLDDARVVHETTPVQPLAGALGGHRDTLVVTVRAGGFQGP